MNLVRQSEISMTGSNGPTVAELPDSQMQHGEARDGAAWWSDMLPWSAGLDKMHGLMYDFEVGEWMNAGSGPCISRVKWEPPL